MSRIVCAVIGLAIAAGPAFAQDPAAEKPRPGTAEAVIHALRQPAGLDGDTISEATLAEILQKLSEHHGVRFLILDDHFRAEGVVDIRNTKPSLPANDLKGLTLHQFLTRVFDHLGAAYLVKGGRIEVVTCACAERLTGAAAEDGLGGTQQRVLTTPLVSVVLKQKPLKDVLEEVAEQYDLNVVICPRVEQVLETPITARLLNVPADQILDRLVVPCDLRAVQQGNTFLITTREHALELFQEQMEIERQTIELARLALELEWLRAGLYLNGGETWADPHTVYPAPAPRQVDGG
jgi:hypothetical protein